MICMEDIVDNLIFETNKNGNNERNEINDVYSIGFIGWL